MSVTAATESKYKSFMKPVKFWQRPSQPKESDTNDVIAKNHSQQQDAKLVEEKVPELETTITGRGFSFGFGSKKQQARNVVVLAESGKTEVYKLSTINGTGLYMPPSPSLQGKRDHWIDVNEDDIMDFRLPSSKCLTTHIGEKHDFYTPYTLVRSQPYILPISCMSDSTISTVPSFIEDDTDSDFTTSARSSTSFS